MLGGGLLRTIAKVFESPLFLFINMFTFQSTERRSKTQEDIDLIKANNMKVGLTLNPDTPVDAILNYGNQIDLALIMTVYP